MEDKNNKRFETKNNKFYSIGALIVIWVLAAVVPLCIITTGASKTAACILIVTSTLILSILYILKIFLPLQKLSDYIKEIGKGNFAERITLQNANPDVLQISNELDTFINSTLNNLISNLKIEVLHTQDNSNEFLTKVQDAVTNSSRISLGADYIRERVENLKKLSDGNESENTLIRQSISEYRGLVRRQSDEIEATGKTVDEIISDLKNSVKKLDEKKELSAKLNTITKDVSEKVEENTAAVLKISENLDTLHTTIKVIASVANKTNLLAMNASIEAAHAGSAGTGFAVVADEIRSLSEKTNKQVKAITQSLKGMTLVIEQAVNTSHETGNAFVEIRKQVGNYVDTFDHVIDDYTASCHKNEVVASGYENIREIEYSLNNEVEKIDTSIKKNSQKLDGINVCIDEIGNIVDRNTKEALQLSRSQDPIYKNAVNNGKNLELIRRRIDVFRLNSVPKEVWLADKNELWDLIQALFDHLDWTVILLDYLHGQSNDIKVQLQQGSSPFDKWLYGTAQKNYPNRSSVVAIVQLNSEIHEKAQILVRLRDAGKEQEATIEFSEVLEISRKIVVQMGELKSFIVKKVFSKNGAQDIQNDSAVESVTTDEVTIANESFAAAEEAINKNVLMSEADTVEELEEL